MLIVMAGLPGAGKSAVASELARRLGCAALSVDPVEAALWRAGVTRDQPTGLAAYVVCESLAAEQMHLGHSVVVDAVNDAEPARQQWRSLAKRSGHTLTFVEVFCSDAQEHRRRLALRQRGLEGFPEPTWDSVVARSQGFNSWTEDRLRVDSMNPLEDTVGEVLRHLGQTGQRTE